MMSLGTYQTDAIRNITGTIQQRKYDSPSGNIVTCYPDRNKSGAFSFVDDNGEVWGDLLAKIPNSSGRKNTLISFDASRTVPTAAENRPKSTSLNYYIYVY